MNRFLVFTLILIGVVCQTSIPEVSVSGLASASTPTASANTTGSASVSGSGSATIDLIATTTDTVASAVATAIANATSNPVPIPSPSPAPIASPIHTPTHTLTPYTMKAPKAPKSSPSPVKYSKKVVVEPPSPAPKKIVLVLNKEPTCESILEALLKCANTKEDKEVTIPYECIQKVGTTVEFLVECGFLDVTPTPEPEPEPEVPVMQKKVMPIVKKVETHPIYNKKTIQVPSPTPTPTPVHAAMATASASASAVGANVEAMSEASASVVTGTTTFATANATASASVSS